VRQGRPGPRRGGCPPRRWRVLWGVGASRGGRERGRWDRETGGRGLGWSRSQGWRGGGGHRTTGSCTEKKTGKDYHQSYGGVSSSVVWGWMHVISGGVALEVTRGGVITETTFSTDRQTKKGRNSNTSECAKEGKNKERKPSHRKKKSPSRRGKRLKRTSSKKSG